MTINRSDPWLEKSTPNRRQRKKKRIYKQERRDEDRTALKRDLNKTLQHGV